MTPVDPNPSPISMAPRSEDAPLDVDFAEEIDEGGGDVSGAGQKRPRGDLPVLVVDDYQPAQRLLQAQLHELGFRRVHLSAGAEDALGSMRFRTFGLILSDWKMGPMNGLDFLRAVRRDPAHGTAPFLMVTGAREARMFAMARDAGATGYVVKPFTLRALEGQIARALGEA